MSLIALKNLWKTKDTRMWSIWAGGILTILLFLGTPFMWRPNSSLTLPSLSSSGHKTLTEDLMRQLYTIESLVERSYVEPLSQEKKREMIEGALSGMMKVLDAHSSYLTPEMMEELQESMQGEFCGVGVEVMPDTSGGLKIISAIDGSSAAQAGLKTGDIILKINQQWITELPPHQVSRQMRGRPGTILTLTLRRQNHPLFTVTLKRHTVHFKSVHWNREEGHVGYIRISLFDNKAKRLVTEALAQLQKKTLPPLAALVIDVRHNPGGFLGEAIGVADLFLEKGAIVSTRTADNPEGTIIYANPKTRQHIHKIPLVLLVDAGSASSAELLAGALQDNYKAIVVGERTFGKASMQAVYPLEKGAGIKLTIAQYDTPSGNSIQGKGITPDIYIPSGKLTSSFTEHMREENLEANSLNKDKLVKKISSSSSKVYSPTLSHQKFEEDFQKSYALNLAQGLAAQQRNLNSRLESQTPTLPLDTIAQRE